MIMPVRPRTAIRDVNGSGLMLTEQDLARVAALARWYCLTGDHLARMEHPTAMWHPGLGCDPEDFDARQVRAVKRRLTRLSQIADAGAHIGPVVGSVALPARVTGWFCTAYGATAADVPWTMPQRISPFVTAHAFAAADIGTQLERVRIPDGPADGFQVLAEREIRTGVDRFGEHVGAKVESKYVTDAGLAMKSPDLVVLDRARSNYIAVEVEGTVGRPLKTYREKMIGYQQNPAVLAVWYVCTRASEGKRDAMWYRGQAILGNGVRTDHPVPNLPFVDDSVLPLNDPAGIEAVGRHQGEGRWGRYDPVGAGWKAFTTDPDVPDLAWIVLWHPAHGRTVWLVTDDEASSVYDGCDAAMLIRAGGYWWDGTTWYRPSQVFDMPSETYVRREVPGARAVTARDLITRDTDLTPPRRRSPLPP